MFVVPKKLLITVEERDIHFIAPGGQELCRRKRAEQHGE